MNENKIKIISSSEEEFKELSEFLDGFCEKVRNCIGTIKKDRGNLIVCVLKQQSGENIIIDLPKKVYNINRLNNTIVINCGGYYMRIDEPMSNKNISYNFNRSLKETRKIDYLKISG